MTSNLHPALIFFVGALLVAMVRGRLQALLAILVPVVGAWNIIHLHAGTDVHVTFLTYALHPMHVDRLSLLFGYLFHLAAFIGLIYAWRAGDTLQRVSGILYAGSALGAVFAGDLITLFVFWELLALTSVFLIWARRTPRAMKAGLRYLIIQVVSGVMLLAGAIIHYHETGSLEFGYIGLGSLASWVIFLAIGIKCAWPGLHNWLTDAYPEATPVGTVFLSAFTTKVAVYALARAFPGTELLIYIGAAMAAFPIFFAVIENDLRRVLGYSMINQIGFMVCGIGIGTNLALNGAVAHAFNDVLFKGLLFMTMGAVLYRTGKMNGSDLGGLYKSMPVTAGFCMVGAASISAFPLFSGFVSKSMVMAALLHEHHIAVWFVFLFASAGVFHHAGIKIPFFAFYAHDAKLRVKEAPRSMLIAMGIGAALCIFIGSYPKVLYSLLPYAAEYVPYTGTHVLTQCQLLFWSALAFTFLKLNGLYPPELRSVNLDVEWFYRTAAPAVARGVTHVVRTTRAAFVAGVLAFTNVAIDSARSTFGPGGRQSRTWPTGAIAMIAAFLLGVYLVLFYL